MKKLVFVASLFFLLFFLAPVDASAGFLAPSSRFYFLQNAFENARLLLTFSEEKKLDYLLELTDRRVSEMESSDDKHLEKIASRYENHFNEVGEILGKMQNQERVSQRIRENNLRQQEVLSRVYEQVPEEAQGGIAKAQESSVKNVAKIVEKHEGSDTVVEYLEEVQVVQQVEIQKQIDVAPMETAPAQDPSETAPKELKSGQPEQGSKELKSVKELNEITGESGGDDQMEPAGPVEMQQPAGQSE